MNEDLSLLPPNSTPWEIAQSVISAERRPLDAEIIRRLWSPQNCPEEFLPWLAWGLGLEVWKDDWPEAKKRDVVARIWKLKRLKTTPQGIRDYVNLVDAEVVKFVRPRDRMWWVPAMSETERAAIMARMPEIRIYPGPPVSDAGPAQVFYGYSFWSAGAWIPSDAAKRWTDRAVFVEEGIETRVTVAGLEGAVDASYTVALRARRPWKDFYSRLAVTAFRIPSDATDHVIAITPNKDAQSFAVAPGLIPVSVRPEPVAETVAAPPWKAFHWPSFFNASFRTPSDAALHLYDRLRFMDPGNVGAFGRPMSFWGWSRSAIEPFTAEVTLQAPIKKPVWSFGAWWGVGFWRSEPLDPLWDALEAITIAQAARDDIRVSLKLYEPITFSAGLRFGAFNFGDDRKVA